MEQAIVVIGSSTDLAELSFVAKNNHIILLTDKEGLMAYNQSGAFSSLKFVGTATGSTADRPNNAKAGTLFFDTTLNKPIWWTGSNWVDANGTTV